MKRGATVLFLFGIILVSNYTSAENLVPRPPMLSEITLAVDEELGKIEKALAETAKMFALTPFKGAEAEKILSRLCSISTYFVDCCLIDASGKLVTIEPEKYKSSEGSDISKQPHIITMQRTGRPVLSEQVKSVEGPYAVAFVYPIKGGDGRMTGSVAILFQPSAMMEAILASKKDLDSIPVRFTLIQKDGIILYDANKTEVGRKLLSDPLYRPYPSLVLLGRRMIEDKSGSGSYEFRVSELNKKVIKKDASWDSTISYGNEWRLIMIHHAIPSNTTGGIAADSAAISRTFTDLRELAAVGGLRDLVKTGNYTEMTNILKSFHDNHKFLYSIQFVDSDGVVRAGYPKTNSIVGYDFKKLAMPEDERFVKALKERKRTFFKMPLFEGNIGNFTMEPVTDGDKFLGFVYFIQVITGTW